MRTEQRYWRWAAVFIVLALIAIILIGFVLAYAMGRLRYEKAFLPEIALPILLISGVSALLLVLSSVVAIFSALSLSDRAHGLGLPEGSVRAVIALSLILIFVIASMFLYANLTKEGLGEVHTTTGLSEEMVQAWLSAEAGVVAIDAREEAGVTVYDVEREVDGKKEVETGLSQRDFERWLSQEGVIVSIIPREESGERVYDVLREVGQSQASEDFAKQILTTVSTLVVAIAGFYFGTRAVAAARGVTVSLEPSIKDITPKVGEAGKEYPVKISGMGFDGPVEVKLVKGTKTALEIKGDDALCSSKEIACTFDLKGVAPGVYDLVVVNEDGGRDQEDEAFTVYVVPTVDAITAKVSEGKADLTIQGKDFDRGAKVELKREQDIIPAQAEGKEIGEKEIKCTFDLAGKTPGTWAVVVTNPGAPPVEADAFTTVTVPDVAKDGKTTTKEEAARQLEAVGLKPKWDRDDAADTWLVVSQDPLKDEQVAKGSDVTVKLKQPGA